MGGRIAVVDDTNRFVRWEDRATIHTDRLVHRSVYILVFDSTGRLLVQRRHASKQTFPSTWDVSCAGHVEESDYLAGPDDDLDRVYAAVAARELEEELGVSPPISLVGRFGPVAGLHYEQLQLFRAVSDGPFRPQPDEIEALRLLAPSELAAFLAGPEPVTPLLRLWARHHVGSSVGP